MLKIAVFDGGWGGEVVATFLAKELQTVEIIRAIDWKHAPYEGKTANEICQLAEQYLAPHIGKVDLVVIAGYMSAMALDYLKHRYPQQKFVSVGINYYRILKSSTYPDRVTVMMDSELLDTPLCEELRDNLPNSTITMPDCSGWEDLANKGELSPEVLATDLATYFDLPDTSRNQTIAAEALHQDLSGQPDPEYNGPKRPLQRLADKILKLLKHTPPVTAPPPLIHSDVVLILNTNFWDAIEDFEKVFGYQVRVLDFRQKLLHDTCAMLGLRGVHGDRSK